MPQMLKIKRKPLHLDYFRDLKDRMCQLLTWHHPQERLLCIVKYILGDGFWYSRETGLKYQRILKSYSIEGQQDNLTIIKNIEPSYLYHSKMYNVDFIAVPKNKIKKYYYPEEGLKGLMEKSSLDEIESKVVKIATIFKENFGYANKNMGITGSILWKAHTEKSDIDFIIYGNKYAQNFNDQFLDMYKIFPEISPLNTEKRRRYEESFARKTGLPLSCAKKYICKKKWLSIYGDTNLSINFSPQENELPFNYDDFLLEDICLCDVEATITNTEFGFAYPAIYEIREYKILGTPKIPDILIKRIFSFEGALTGYFVKDDQVVVRGLLQKVTDKRRNIMFYQILLGTKENSGNEFILLKNDYTELFNK